MQLRLKSLADNQVRQLVLEDGAVSRILADGHTEYVLVDEAGALRPEDVVLQRMGTDLQVEINGQPVAVLEAYYTNAQAQEPVFSVDTGEGGAQADPVMLAANDGDRAAAAVAVEGSAGTTGAAAAAGSANMIALGAFGLLAGGLVASGLSSTSDSSGTGAGTGTGTGTGPDTSVVVFDLLNGVSSNHSSRTFDANTSYTIYIRVNSNNATLNTTPTGNANSNASWGVWSGGENLGTDDKIVLVGSGSDMVALVDSKGNTLGVIDAVSGSSYVFWWGYQNTQRGSFLPVVSLSSYSANGRERWAWELFKTVWKTTTTITSRSSGSTVLWTGVAQMVGSINAKYTKLSSVYLTNMPQGVLTSQGLV